MRLLAGCLAVHALLARLIPSPWWVLDLTLVGLVMAVSRQPGRWLLICAAAGLFASVWAVRIAWPIVAGALVCGGLVRLAAGRWDLADPRVQGGTVVVLSALTTLGLVWLERLWSWPIAALTVARIAMTGLSLRLLQGLLR